jgi:hypothetical protein
MRNRVVAVIVWFIVATASLASAQALRVPYLPQSEDLCGGAAAAMVMRYWGASDVYPDAFAALVDRAAGGISTTALTADLKRRGWTAVAGSGNSAELVRELRRGRPVIALVEDRPGRFHYVVVTARSSSRVLVHDPARMPSRAIEPSRFDAAWQKSDRWMMILLPPPAASDPVPEAIARPVTAANARCTRLVDDGVARAAEDRSQARGLLERAAATCPDGAAAWRELAGVAALDADWRAAAVHAEHAVALEPDDSHAWRILATARYVEHDDRGALTAWNHVGEPSIDLIDVAGLERTRYDVIADAIGVGLRSVLTPEALGRAERRVRDVPSIAGARVSFHPVEHGHVEIDTSVVERDRVPAGYGVWLRNGFSAVADRELSADFSSMTGGGETAGVAWRWWAHRPMVSAFYAAPAPRAVGGGTWRLDVSRETQTFGRVPVEETHTRAALTLGNWISERTKVSAGAALDRWNDRGDDVAFAADVEHWRMANRVRLGVAGTQAAGRDSFSTGTLTAGVRSRADEKGFVLFAIAGYEAASAAAPVSLWPGADTGHARDVLLRAHPLLEDGIITSGAFGRRLGFATIEAQRWTELRRLPMRLAPAAFVDMAQATRRLDPAEPHLNVDAGAGVRIGLLGTGVIRVDVARGMRDGGIVLSAGWDRRWR